MLYVCNTQHSPKVCHRNQNSASSSWVTEARLLLPKTSHKTREVNLSLLSFQRDPHWGDLAHSFPRGQMCVYVYVRCGVSVCVCGHDWCIYMFLCMSACVCSFKCGGLRSCQVLSLIVFHLIFLCMYCVCMYVYDVYMCACMYVCIIYVCMMYACMCRK